MFSCREVQWISKNLKCVSIPNKLRGGEGMCEMKTLFRTMITATVLVYLDRKTCPYYYCLLNEE